MRRTILSATLAAGFAAGAGADELRYHAVWHAGTGSNIVTGPLDLDAFLARGTELTGQGLRLVDVETAVRDGARVYTGLWRAGSGDNFFVGPLRPPAFRAEMESRRAVGQALVDFEVFGQPPNRRFVGVWRNGGGEELLTIPLDEAAFLARGETLAADGLRLEDVEVVGEPGARRFIGLWRAGTGSNFFVGPRSRFEFLQTRNRMREDGLELVDVERIDEGGQIRFVSVYRNGDGIGQFPNARDFDQFLEIGADLTADGLRTEDHEIFVVPSEGGETDPPDGTGGGATSALLPDLPRWIQLSSNPQLVIDWGTMIEGHPRITLPFNPQLDWLPDWLPEKRAPGEASGELVFPDKICGFDIRMADHVFWQVPGDDAFDDFPFNSIESVAEISTNPEFGGQNFLLGGIRFYGPIVGCAGSGKGWDFHQPFTQTGPFTPEPNMRLVVGLMPSAEIRFIDHAPPAGKVKSAHDLFSDKVFKDLQNIAKSFAFTKVDNGYCGIDAYVRKVCEDAEEEPGPSGVCPVGGDFFETTPC